MKFERQDELPTDEAIRGLEYELGTQLPGDYRKFLLRHAGGYAPEPGYVTIPGWGTTVLQAFLGLDDASSYRLETDSLNDLPADISNRLLQFAEDPNGQAFVLDLRPATFGKVYVYDHDGPPNEATPIDLTGFGHEGVEDARLFHPVADSFSAFVAMLGPTPNETRSHSQE